MEASFSLRRPARASRSAGSEGNRGARRRTGWPEGRQPLGLPPVTLWRSGVSPAARAFWGRAFPGAALELSTRRSVWRIIRSVRAAVRSPRRRLAPGRLRRREGGGEPGRRELGHAGGGKALDRGAVEEVAGRAGHRAPPWSPDRDTISSPPGLR